MAGKYLGTLLMERGILNPQQVEAVLARQLQTGQPFGQTAVVMFDIRMADVWRALAQQHRDTTPRVDLDQWASPQKDALEVIPGRLAWAGKVLPLAFRGATLICATTQRNLCDAMAMLHEKLDIPIDFVLTDELQLKQHIMESYPM